MISSGSFIAHYGIPNMHWGVRRFQDKLGRLTPEGKERYRKHAETQNSESREAFRQKRAASSKTESASSKSISVKDSKRAPGVARGIDDDLKAEQRRRIAKTLLKVAGGVALAAAIAYGASTVVRDRQAMQIKLRELPDTAKDWSLDDRDHYMVEVHNERAAKQKALTRTQAIANLISGKNGYDSDGSPRIKRTPEIGRQEARVHNAYERGEEGRKASRGFRLADRIDLDIHRQRARIEDLQKERDRASDPAKRAEYDGRIKYHQERLANMNTELQNELEKARAARKRRKEIIDRS